MSDPTNRSGIKALLEEITGIGIVHLYERWCKDPDVFIALFKYSGRIQGWEITRTGVPAVVAITKRVKVTSSYVIKGYYSLKDEAATELAFNAIVDLILFKFISKKVTGTQGQSLPKSPVLSALVFGKYLCHYAEISLDVSEIIDPATDEVLTDLYNVGLNYYLKPGDEEVDASDEIPVQAPPEPET
jgi:hypothetical protein